MKNEMIKFIGEIWEWVKWPIGAVIVLTVVRAAYWAMVVSTAWFANHMPQ